MNFNHTTRQGEPDLVLVGRGGHKGQGAQASLSGVPPIPDPLAQGLPRTWHARRLTGGRPGQRGLAFTVSWLCLGPEGGEGCPSQQGGVGLGLPRASLHLTPVPATSPHHLPPPALRPAWYLLQVTWGRKAPLPLSNWSRELLRHSETAQPGLLHRDQLPFTPAWQRMAAL